MCSGMGNYGESSQLSITLHRVQRSLDRSTVTCQLQLSSRTGVLTLHLSIAILSDSFLSDFFLLLLLRRERTSLSSKGEGRRKHSRMLGQQATARSSCPAIQRVVFLARVHMRVRCTYAQVPHRQTDRPANAAATCGLKYARRACATR